MVPSEFFKQHEDKWFLRPGNDRDAFDRLVSDTFRIQIVALLDDMPSYIECTIEGCTSDQFECIIMFDQLARHIYRDDEKTLDRLTDIAFHVAKRMVNNERDLELDFWKRLIVLLAIRHRKCHAYLDLCKRRIRTYDIQSIDDRLRFERFMRKTQRDLEDFCIQPEVSRNPIIDEQYMVHMDEQCTWKPSFFQEKSIPSKPTPIMTHFARRLHETKTNKVVLSLSGGVDSMVIFHLLHQLKVPFACVHIDFAHREESRSEADFVIKFCEHMQVPCHYRRIDEYSRNKHDELSRPDYERYTKAARIRFIQTVVRQEEADAVIFGHHADDIAENVFTNIMHQRSILDIGVCHEFKTTDGIYIWRPFLDFPKSAIIDIAHECKIPYFKNTTPEWCNRRHFRDTLLPAFEEHYGQNIPCQGFLHLSKQSALLSRTIRTNLIDPYLKSVVTSRGFMWLPFRTDFDALWHEIMLDIFHQRGEAAPSQIAVQNLIGTKVGNSCAIRKGMQGYRTTNGWIVVEPEIACLTLDIQHVGKNGDQMDGEQESQCSRVHLLETLVRHKICTCTIKKSKKKGTVRHPFATLPPSLRAMFDNDWSLNKTYTIRLIE